MKMRSTTVGLLALLTATVLASDFPQGYLPVDGVEIPITSSKPKDSVVLPTVQWRDVRSIRFSYSTTNTLATSAHMLFSGTTSLTASNSGSPWLALAGTKATGSALELKKDSISATLGTTPGDAYDRDGSVHELVINISDGSASLSSASYVQFGGAWSDIYWNGSVTFHSLSFVGSDSTALATLVPCVETSTGRAGFYDTVAGTFHTKAQNGWLDFVPGRVAVEVGQIYVTGSPAGFGTVSPAYGLSAIAVDGSETAFSVPQETFSDGLTAVPLGDAHRVFLEKCEISLDDAVVRTSTASPFGYTAPTSYARLEAGWVFTNEQWRTIAVAGDGGTVTLGGAVGTGENAVTNWSAAGTSVTLVATPDETHLFVGWTGDVEGLDASAKSVTLSATRARNLTATWNAKPTGAYWTYEDGQVSDANGNVFAATLVNDEVKLTAVVSLVSSVIDFRLPVYSSTGLVIYPIVEFAAELFKNQKGIKELYLPDGIRKIGNDFVRGCSALWKIEPFLPSTLTVAPSLNSWGCPVTNDLKLCGPQMTVIGNSYYMFIDNIKSVDMTGSSIETFEGAAFNACYGLTNVTFANVQLRFGSAGNVFANVNKLKYLHFRGPPPLFAGTDPFYACPAQTAFYAPKWDKSWEAFLADPVRATVAEIGDSGFSVAVNNHWGEPVPVQTLSMRDTINDRDLTAARCLYYWYPNPPPYYETVAWFDVLGFETNSFTVADEADRVLVDGTTSIPKAYLKDKKPVFHWLAAEGHVAELGVPADCTMTRALKLTGYRLHQLAFGDWPNGRAPTAWKLYGQKLGSSEWTLVDTVTMTAASANAWGYLTDPSSYPVSGKSQACPPRLQRALTYGVPPAAQTCYQAFRFEPTNSYNLENAVDDPTPFGLMELELLGERVTADPKIASFTVSKPRWTSIDFGVTVSGLGESPTAGTAASSALAWVEIYEDAERTTLVTESPKSSVEAGVALTLSAAGLSGASNYHARVVVSNDLNGVVRQDLACATLADPWVVGKIVCTKDAEDENVYTVSLEVAELYAPSVTLSLSRADNPSGTFVDCLQPVTLSAAGTAAFVGELTLGSVTETLKVTATGGGETRTYTGAATEYWITDNASTPTMLTGSVSGKRIGVGVVSGSKLWVKSLDDLGDDGVLDLSLPIRSADGTKTNTITRVGSNYYFKGDVNVTEVIYPKEADDFKTYVLYECPRLKKVTFKGNVSSFPGYFLTSCKNLEEIVFEGTVGTFGYDALDGDSKLSKFVLPESVTSLGGSCFNGCSSLAELTFSTNLTTLGKDALSRCSGLRKLTFEGNVPTIGNILTGMADGWTTLVVVPRKNETWKEYLAAHSTGTDAWVTPLTRAERRAFAEAYPDEPKVKSWIRFGGTVRKLYLGFDPPLWDGLSIIVR